MRALQHIHECLPQASKLTLTLGGTLLSAFSGLLPQNLQYLGLFTGLALIAWGLWPALAAAIRKAKRRPGNAAEGRGLHPHDAPKRIPLMEFRETARASGWDIGGLHGLEGIDLLIGLRQAALDGQVQLFGRQAKWKGNDLLRQVQPIIAIPAEYWTDHHIDWGGFNQHGDDNFAALSTAPGTAPDANDYVDLHVDLAAAIKWLDSDGLKYKGQTARHKLSAA